MNHVIVLGPVPDSTGGIGVLMGHLSRSASNASDMRFVDSGGSPGAALRRLVRFGTAVLTCLGPVPERTVFHVNQSSNLSTWRKLALVTLLRLRRRPYVLHLHGGGFAEFLAGLSPWRARLVCNEFRNASAVIVLGKVWERYIRSATGIDPERIHVIPNAVPGPPEPPGQRRRPLVLFSGKLTRAKGVLELLEAWRSVPDPVRSTLVLVGDLDDQDGDIRRALESAPDVETTGWVGSEELNEKISCSSILVLPSHAENLPLSLLDAMAWGLAPVVTDVGAVPEVVEDGVTGRIVPVGDARALARALESLLLDRRLRESIGSAARLRWEERYSLSGYRDRLDEVYEAALAARERSRS